MFLKIIQEAVQMEPLFKPEKVKKLSTDFTNTRDVKSGFTDHVQICWFTIKGLWWKLFQPRSRRRSCPRWVLESAPGNPSSPTLNTRYSRHIHLSLQYILLPMSLFQLFYVLLLRPAPFSTRETDRKRSTYMWKQSKTNTSLSYSLIKSPKDWIFCNRPP